MRLGRGERSARRLATCSAVAFGPSAMRAGSPGMTRAMAKIQHGDPDQHQDQGRPQHVCLGDER